MQVKCVMDRSKLLEIVRENEKQHEAMVADARKGYCEQAMEACAGFLKELESGKTIRVYLSLRAPEDHTRDYQRAIKMLELTEQSQIELTERDFAQLVDDDWEWTESWVASNKTLSSVVDEYASMKGL